VVLTLATFAIVLNGGRFGSNILVDAHFDAKRMPVEAVNFLEQYAVSGPILSPDYWGGYLIYRLYPKDRVVVDDRHDLYGADFLKSYLRMVHLEQGWEEFLQQTAPECVLIPRNSALASILSKTTGWKVVYEDQVSMAFVKSS